MHGLFIYEAKWIQFHFRLHKQKLVSLFFSHFSFIITVYNNRQQQKEKCWSEKLRNPRLNHMDV